jgi:hypothetical protein
VNAVEREIDERSPRHGKGAVAFMTVDVEGHELAVDGLLDAARRG